MDNTNEIEMFSPEEMQSPFEVIKETDGDGHEWWNSRKLARLMGYQKYWNFERLMDKVSSFLQQEKGLDLKEHMVEIEEMAWFPIFVNQVLPSYILVIPLGLTSSIPVGWRQPSYKVKRSLKYLKGRFHI